MDQASLLLLLLGGFGSIFVYWIGDTVINWVRGGRVSILDQAEVDHIVCEDDDCDQVLCYCGDVDQPCPGTVEPGCDHVGEFFCEDHRFDCVECRIGYSEEYSVDLAEDQWRGLA